jgi:hypothetical protein
MILRQKLPSQKDLKNLFRYDKKGFFIRKVKTGYATKAGQVVGATKRRDGYCQMRVGGLKYLTHRLVFLYHRGFCPDHVDHINQKPWDNRIENLEASTHAKNMANRKIFKNNRSGHKGVYFCKTHKVWKAQFKKDKKKQSFSSKNKKDCVAFYNSLRRGK